MILEYFNGIVKLTSTAVLSVHMLIIAHGLVTLVMLLNVFQLGLQRKVHLRLNG